MKKVKNVQSLECPVTKAGPLSIFLRHFRKQRGPACNALQSFWGGVVTVSDYTEKGEVLWAMADWYSGWFTNVYPGIRTVPVRQSL